MLASLLSFGFAFQRLQAIVPEFVQKRLHALEAFRARSVVAPGAVPPFAHESGLLQHGEVLGDRGPGDLETRGDLTGGELVVADEAQNLPPPWLDDCLQRSFHRRKYKQRLN
jgi:hypothetical protein